MCFEVRAPSSTSPPSPRRISNPLGVPNSSLNQYNRYRGNTNGLPKTGVPNSTIPPIQPTPPLPKREQYQHQLHLTKREQITTSTSTKEGAIHNPNPPLPKRDTTNEGLQQGDHKRTQTQFFHK